MTGGDALVNSGVMESLLQVLEWKAVQPMNITVSESTVHGVRSVCMLCLLVSAVLYIFCNDFGPWATG